jgi:hypothetical protein
MLNILVDHGFSLHDATLRGAPPGRQRISAITKAEFIMRQSFLVPSSWFFRPHRDGALQRFTRSSRYFPGAKF